QRCAGAYADLSKVACLPFRSVLSVVARNGCVSVRDVIPQKGRCVRSPAAPVIVPQRIGDAGWREALFSGQVFKQQLHQMGQRDSSLTSESGIEPIAPPHEG